MSATLDIDLLRTFHAVARNGQFKAAAEQLHKSPAAISVHVQKLELIAGGKLLRRDNQSVALTALGKRLLAATGPLLCSHDQVLADLHGTRLAGRIQLGIPDEYAAHVIRDILPLFVATWPNVVLDMHTAPSYSLLDQVRRGKLQAALIACPTAAPAAQGTVILATTPVWVAAAHATLEASAPLPLALYAADCPYRQAMLDALRHSARPWRVVLDSPSTQAVEACVEAGLAISLVDRARVSVHMRVLDDLPAVAEHQVRFIRADATTDAAALDLLERAMAQYFRL